MSITIVGIVFGGCLYVLTAAPASVGIARSPGDFRVDGAAIHGNGTLFEGDVVETASARSVIQLEGSQITLLPDSRMKVYRDHAVLEKGSSLVQAGRRQVIEAGELRIAPSADDSTIQVERRTPALVAVSAKTGSAEVRNARGILVASVRTGLALAFEPQGASTSVRITGTLRTQDGKYFVTDETTGVTTEVQGPDLASNVGRRVQVTGSTIPGVTPAGNATQVVREVSITRLSGGAGAAGGGAAGAGAAGGGGIGGLGTAATVAIIGGVAVAGTLGGLAAAGTFSSGPSSTP